MILCVSVRYLSGHLGPFFHNCDLRLLRLRVPRLREGCKPFSSSVTTPPTFGASRGRVLSAAVAFKIKVGEYFLQYLITLFTYIRGFHTSEPGFWSLGI